MRDQGASQMRREKIPSSGMMMTTGGGNRGGLRDSGSNPEGSRKSAKVTWCRREAREGELSAGDAVDENSVG